MSEHNYSTYNLITKISFIKLKLSLIFNDFSFYGKFNSKPVSRKWKRILTAKYAFQMR